MGGGAERQMAVHCLTFAPRCESKPRTLEDDVTSSTLTAEEVEPVLDGPVQQGQMSGEEKETRRERERSRGCKKTGGAGGKKNPASEQKKIG